LEDSDLEDEDVGSEMIVEDEEYQGYDDDDDHDSESAGSEDEDDVLTRAPKTTPSLTIGLPGVLPSLTGSKQTSTPLSG
jgi:hypothetical protein